MKEFRTAVLCTMSLPLVGDSLLKSVPVDTHTDIKVYLILNEGTRTEKGNWPPKLAVVVDSLALIPISVLVQRKIGL